MIYKPVDVKNKQQWVDWLNSQVEVLNGKGEDVTNNYIFETPEGDIGTAKDLVGTLLATITNQTITIN